MSHEMPKANNEPVVESADKQKAFAEQLENLIEMKELSNRPGGGSAYMLRSTLNDLETMAAGGNPDGVRDQYYPGWEDGDFKKLLEEFAKINS